VSLDPEFVTDEDLDDLSSFTGMDREACLERLRAYRFDELAEAFRHADPKTAEERIEFYGSTDLEIWELMQWHASRSRQPYREALEAFARDHSAEGWPRVLDFGSGVGTDALFLAERGYEVTLVDVEGPAFRFARHRFDRRGIAARFLESRSPLPRPDGIYDAVVCFDVFSHLPDPLGAARRLISALREGGIMLQRGAFGAEDVHPDKVEEHVRRFAGMKWHIHLAGLGLRTLDEFTYQKVTGAARAGQRLRYALWKATGLWLIKVER
jgi:SAM-dependent methyltransferase